jgi:hypothetical protein
VFVSPSSHHSCCQSLGRLTFVVIAISRKQNSHRSQPGDLKINQPECQFEVVHCHEVEVLPWNKEIIATRLLLDLPLVYALKQKTNNANVSDKQLHHTCQKKSQLPFKTKLDSLALPICHSFFQAGNVIAFDTA